MFGSRKNRPPNPPLNASNISPSAATAALTAFRRDSTASNSSLSAAAAAAALRARPATPTNVAQVQTKRTVRRSASASSNHHSPDRGPSLRRQSSSGSMTERTFRSPSPGSNQRSLSSGGTPRTPFAMSDVEAPPVPAIPESVNMAAAKARGGTRPKSLGFMTPPVKTASQRMAEKTQGGTWFGAARVGDLGSVRKNDAATKISASQRQHAQTRLQQQEEPRSESRGSSVNFSYPARVRVASPVPGIVEQHDLERAAAPKPKKRSSTLSPQRGGPVRSARPASIASDRELVYDPNSRRMVPRSEILALEQFTRPKKKKSAPNHAGSHLARGTIGRIQGAAVDHGVPNEAQMAATASLKLHQLEEARQPEDQQEHDEEELVLEHDSEPERQELERPMAPEPPIRHTVIPTSPASNAPVVYSPLLSDQQEGGLQRRPSVVKEESDESQSEAELELPTDAAAALDAVPVRHIMYPHGVPSPPQSENTDDQVRVEPAAASTSSTGLTAPTQERLEPRRTQSLRRESRTQSNSPGRSAHFGPVQETLTVKHEPPVRSLSPRKSALKRSPSRGASPADDRSDVSGVDVPTQEPPPQRKKSVRVSFDDEKTVVLGEAAGRGETGSPVPPSPQQVATGAKKPWYSTLGIGRKKDAIPLEEDEVMKPRPALPMFGSIRGRKLSPAPAEERALVRPHERLDEVSESSSPELERRMPAFENVGQSSESALGFIMNDQGARNGANISKQREPLPPVVTSIEGNGCVSESASSEDESAMLVDTPKLQVEETGLSQAPTLVPPTDSSVPEQSATDVRDFGAKSDTVPSISLTQPSPQPEQTGQERNSYLHFPGGFPETETETKGENNGSTARLGTFEPMVQTGDAKVTAHTPATVLATQPAVAEPRDDSEESSVYSDAYEDLSDLDGDGFLSLDAVVDSPVITTPPRHVLEKAQAQRAEMVTPTPQSRQLMQPSSSEPEDQWAAAKAYWRSLTADKRAQLEKEAVEEAGSEADLEDVQPEAKKPRRKKSVDKRNAEKKAIKQQRTADLAADPPSRTYLIKPGTKAGPVEDPPSDVKASKSRVLKQAASEKAESSVRLRKSMRASAEPQPVESRTHIRKSMRAPPETQPVQSGTNMRKAMRSQPAEQQAPRQRPVSLQSLGNTTEVSSNKTRRSRAMSDSSPTAAVLQSNLRRRGSDSSASSFRRARPATGTLGFRKTMRPGTSHSSVDVQDPGQQQTSSRRVSLRGVSPPVSMRKTLRGERRRSSESGNSYLRFPGSSGKSGKRGTPKSRFGDDSSDENEGSGRRFASRFEDSSDEDLSPAEPMPRLRAKMLRSRRRGPPSPPLPEEEESSEEEAPIMTGDEQKTPGVTSADTSLGRSRSGRGLDAGPRKRHSFISSVLWRKSKPDSPGRISRPELTESAARHDTRLERSADDLVALWSSSKQDSPKRQKRMTLPSQRDSHLDLTRQQTHETVGDEDKDVFYDAADGQEAASVTSPRSPSVLAPGKSQPSIPRPAFLMRRTMSTNGTINTDGIGGEGGEVTRKKKKFGALRKMFRLDE